MAMSLLDSPETDASTSAQRLRGSTAAVRVSLRWLGVRKTLTPEQKTQAAETFDAESDFLSARKKLLDTSHPAYKEVTTVRGRVIAYWKALTLPYPEPGVRLIKQSQIEAFDEAMQSLRTELDQAVAKLDERYGELRAAARQRLGSLYDPDDYPPSLKGLFELFWDFPSLEPPDYLMQLNPAIYEQERARVASRFEEAARLAEQAFLSEFGRLVAHLAERLSGVDGEKKVFRNSIIGNLQEFFQRFKNLSVRGNDELDRLVEQAQRVVRGIEPQELRDNASLRQHVASQLAGVQSVIDGLMVVDQPRRSIVRNRPTSGGE